MRGRTDGRYQVHYLPRFAVRKGCLSENVHTVDKQCMKCSITAVISAMPSNSWCMKCLPYYVTHRAYILRTFQSSRMSSFINPIFLKLFSSRSSASSKKITVYWYFVELSVDIKNQGLSKFPCPHFRVYVWLHQDGHFDPPWEIGGMTLYRKCAHTREWKPTAGKWLPSPGKWGTRSLTTSQGRAGHFPGSDTVPDHFPGEGT